MYSDPTYREYLLGLGGADVEADIEEAILAGGVDPEHLYQVEDELIDDLLFDRLSAQELRVVQVNFLSSPRRAAKLEFSRALQEYAARHTSPARHRSMLISLRDWMGPEWLLPFIGALACSVIATAALTVRNVMLKRELASVSLTSDERGRAIASLQQPTEPLSSHSTEPDQASTIELSPGLTRGISALPVLNLAKQAGAAVIVLELPVRPSGSLRVELLDSNEKEIWSQRFANAAGLPGHGLLPVTLPVGLLPSGDYYIQVEVAGSANEAAHTAKYSFRVRKD